MMYEQPDELLLSTNPRDLDYINPDLLKGTGDFLKCLGGKHQVSGTLQES